jgi:hypothetical protein
MVSPLCSASSQQWEHTHWQGKSSQASGDSVCVDRHTHRSPYHLVLYKWRWRSWWRLRWWHDGTNLCTKTMLSTAFLLMTLFVTGAMFEQSGDEYPSPTGDE